MVLSFLQRVLTMNEYKTIIIDRAKRIFCIDVLTKFERKFLA